MGDRLDQLVQGHAVVDGATQVTRRLVGAVQRHERSDGDRAAVPLRETGPLSDVSEEHVIGQLHELRREVTDQLLRRRRSLRHLARPRAPRRGTRCR